MSITKREIGVTDIEEVLRHYSKITLEELQADHLMSRFDEKYVFHVSKLASFLNALRHNYRLLSVNNKLMASYENTYFDTPELKSYHDHHNGRTSRFKIRYRRYNDSGMSFLEVKRKDNRGITTKERFEVKTFNPELSPSELRFVEERTNTHELKLQPSLRNRFNRITLVNKNIHERVTLDLMIEFRNQHLEKELNSVVIAEVKQEQHNYDSAFKRLMLHERIFPMNISKYCVGTVLTHPGIKYNRFKPKLLTLNKICNVFA